MQAWMTGPPQASNCVIMDNPEEDQDATCIRGQENPIRVLAGHRVSVS